jgi:oxygen-dependent protoporphyrinogen oxidase
VDNGRPVLDADIAVGKLVRQRFGDEIVTKLVDPMLGGVYAGRADELSIATTMPGLFQGLLAEPTLSAAVRRAIDSSRAHSGGGPVFGTVAGGLSRVIEAAARELGGRVHLGEFVRELPETPTVLAIPGPKAAGLLPSLDLGLDYASVALVTFAFPEPALGDLPEMSGFLVPESEGLSIKAATFFSKKWEHIGGCVVRVSLGRAGDAASLQAPDEALMRTALHDLSKVVGDLPEPESVKLNRWGGGLPQYPVNHLDHVQEARESLRDRPVALAGAAFDGVGIPACAKSGTAAAELLLERWMT